MTLPTELLVAHGAGVGDTLMHNLKVLGDITLLIRLVFTLSANVSLLVSIQVSLECRLIRSREGASLHGAASA